MGVIVSYLNGNVHSNEPDPVTGLTPKEKMLVLQSWNLVRKDSIASGMQLFCLFFKKFPEYQQLFPFRDVSEDDLPINPKLKAHAVNVMYTLSAVIDNLNNNDVLVNLLEKVGSSHGKRNTAEKSFWDLKETVMELLQTALGPKFSNDTKDAWDKTLSVAMNVIIKSL